MKNTIKTALVLITAVIFFIAAQQIKVTAQSGADEVTWSADKGQNYNTDTGTITNENYDGLVLKLKNGVERKIKYDQIKFPINYNETPNDFDKANKAMEARDYKQATELYTKVINDTRLRSIFKQTALYNNEVIYQKTKQFDKAVQACDDSIKTYPQGRYIRQSFMIKSECHALSSNLQAALTTLDDAKTKLSQLENMDQKYILEIELRKGNLLENNDKIEDAQTIYNGLIIRASREPAISARAQVGSARVELIKKNYPEAEKKFTEVIEKYDDDLAKAAAYNGRAACTMAGSPAGSETYKKALLDYLHSKLLYPAPEGESTDEEENATYNSGLCWDKLGQSSSDQKKKQYFNNNAKGFYEELVQRFPLSKLAPLAQKRLNELSR